MKAALTKRSIVVPTLQIIADKAGVSRETVSHILGGKLAQRYKEATREKVLEIARELNYRPHRAAQAMKTGHSNLIAIVHFGGEIEAARQSNLVLSRIVQEHGYDYLSIDMNWCGGCLDRTLAEIIRGRAEGVLISHIQEVFQEKHIDELRRAGIPIVSVNGGRRPNVPLINDNVGKAIGELTGHLIANGHKRLIQPLCSVSHLDAGQVRSVCERKEGFRRAIMKQGKYLSMSEEEFLEKWPCLKRTLKKEIVGITVEQDAALYECLDRPVYRFCKKLFPSGHLPDAMVCQNDFYAMEVIAAGLEHDVRVPRDLALTGYDNDRIGNFPCFNITTAEQDIEGICQGAVDLLIKLIATPGFEAADQMFDSKVILRNSSASSAKSLKSFRLE